MKYNANSPEEYIRQLPEERQAIFEKLRKIIRDNIPDGFEEAMSYGMIGYVIPHRVYPSGYHVDPKLPVPFIAIASQKNHIAFYHMGIYIFPQISTWFKDEFPKHSKKKLDMDKSCIRFRKPEDVPLDLIAELCRKISAQDFLKKYEEGKQDTKQE